MEYLKIIFSTDKRYIIVLIIEAFASLFWALAPLGLTGYILTIYNNDQEMNQYMVIIIVCAIYTMFRIIVSTITMYIYNELTNKIYRNFNHKMTKRIISKVLDVDLLTYQSSEFLNNYQKVIDNVSDYMVNTFWDINSLVSGLASLLSIGTILSTLNPIIMIYGIIIGICSYFISKSISKIMHNLSEKNKQLIRERGYVRRVFYLKDYAIDLRTTPINQFYLDKNNEYGEEIINNLKYYYKRYNLLNSLDHALLNSVFAVALTIVIMAVKNNSDIVLLATLLSSILYLSDDISYFSSSIASYKANIIYKNDYFRLMDYSSEIEMNNKTKEIKEFETLEFKNVEFSYGDKKALDNVSLKINKYDKKYCISEKKGRKYRVIEDVVYQIVTNFVTYAYLMYQVYEGKISIGEFTSLSASIYKFINRFYNFSRNIANLKDKFMYVEDFLWLMEYEPNIENFKIDENNIQFQKLSFQNVNFKYANKEKYALNNINIEIKKGEKIAIIGYNGAGKTTFTKLLLKLYNPESGKIYINDIDYNDLKANQIRNMASIILQNFQIYSATVLENVLMREKRYDNDEKIVIDALKKVGLYEKIMALPNKLDTVLTKEFSHEGIDLSGGERQKLAIARVLASNSPIAILDEPTSALDPYAEKSINDNIIASANDKTIIIISHRLSTIVNVDKIYVMKDGVIEESGTHDELINKKGIYYTMFSAQAELYVE